MINNKCKEHAEKVKSELKEFFTKNPAILAILTNGRPDGERYIRNKIKVAQELGVETHVYDVTGRNFGEVAKFMGTLTEDGIMVQMPFFDVPALNDILRVWIPYKKDVDGLNPETKAYTGIVPATARGIFECFFKDTQLRVGVLGRSKLVGDPLVNLLMHSKNTVVACHSQSENHWGLLSHCDAIVTATGTTTVKCSSFAWFNMSNIKLLVDVGIRVGEDGKLQGDVDKKLYELPDIDITPVPNGVGLLTTAYLYWNLKKLKEQQCVNPRTV